MRLSGEIVSDYPFQPLQQLQWQAVTWLMGRNFHQKWHFRLVFPSHFSLCPWILWLITSGIKLQLKMEMSGKSGLTLSIKGKQIRLRFIINYKSRPESSFLNHPQESRRNKIQNEILFDSLGLFGNRHDSSRGIC